MRAEIRWDGVIAEQMTVDGSSSSAEQESLGAEWTGVKSDPRDYGEECEEI